MRESFSVNDVVAFVNQNAALPPAERKERVERDIELILEGRSDIFFNSNTHNAVCWNRAPFFKGTKIKILPSRLEIKDGVLLYGARFAPFCSDELFADEYLLSVKGTKGNCRWYPIPHSSDRLRGLSCCSDVRS